MHPSITSERICELLESGDLSNPGIRTACGADADGCEPDARNYMCEECGEYSVFGAEELLFEIVD